MKKLFIVLLALWAASSTTTQACLPGGITFTTQQQVNAFQTNYPGCKQIEGDVTIYGYNITNLNGLSILNSIGGNLNIECNEVLTSLTGLNNLTYIGGSLNITGNLLLISTEGLQNVSYIGGDLLVANNLSLADLSGMNALASINGDLWIDDNHSLSGLTGLSALVSVAGAVKIYSNDALLNLSGLESLTSIGGGLAIGGLGHLGGIGNNSLANIQALNSLTSVGGSITIGYNIVLTSLSGLDNINEGSVTGLSIFNNDTLSDCEVAGICKYLSNPTGAIYISDNAPGCNSLEELEEGCLLNSVVTARNIDKFSLYPNPSPDYIIIETPSTPDTWHLSLADLRGREIIRCEINNSYAEISITGLPAGIYFARITNDRTFMTKKFVRQ
jgi:hypothetical protein